LILYKMNWRLKSDYKIKRGDFSLFNDLLRQTFFRLATFAGKTYGMIKVLLKLK